MLSINSVHTARHGPIRGWLQVGFATYLVDSNKVRPHMLIAGWDEVVTR